MYNMTEIDLFNASNSSENIQEAVGEQFAFTGMGVLADEEQEVAYIVKEDGRVYGCISAMLVDAVKHLIPMLEKDNTIKDKYDILITTGMSKSNREYYRMTLVPKRK